MTSQDRVAARASHGRHVLSFFIAIGAVVVLAGAACSSSSGAGAAAATQLQACSLNSDCAMGLICALGKCSVACRMDSDCMTGENCAVGPGPGDSGNIAACVSNIMACNTQADCPTPLACASDYRCRNLCTTASDCNVLGIMGEVCGVDSQGVHYCAAMSDTTAETADGGGTIYVITEAPPTGASGTVVEPDGSVTVASGSSSSSSGGSSGSSSGSGGSSGGGSSSGGGCACGAGFECVDGSCAPCGGQNDICCAGNACSSSINLACLDGMCVCGGGGQVCCAGGTPCNGGVSCTGGMCACGSAGAACCPTTGAGAAASACTGGLECAGTACSCQIGCSGDVVMGSNGYLWPEYETGSTLTAVPAGAGTGFFIAGTVSSYYPSYTYSGSEAQGLSCAVDTSGGVWCWGENNYGQLGNGSTNVTSSTTPVQVVTGIGANAANLQNIKSVYVDGASGYLACAIDTSAKVWCWGYGEEGALGNGSSSYNTVIAAKVQTEASTDFVGADELSVAEDHVCAHVPAPPDAGLSAGSGQIWCWGSNSEGQLGVGTTSSTPTTYPVQVAALFSDALSVSVGDDLSCALANDSTVYCWGTNTYGALGSGVSSSTTAQTGTPTHVVTASGGTTSLTGISQLQVSSYDSYGSTCALRASDGSLWCWGEASGENDYASIYAENSVMVSGVYLLCPNGSSSPSYIDSKGSFHSDGALASQQVTCP
jgi:uncharacterized membrane protein YgcG